MWQRVTHRYQPRTLFLTDGRQVSFRSVRFSSGGVQVLREGKEPGQGVGFLEDGTMVVVDNARKMIGKTIDTAVTSVLQTTAGKMIFGRYEEKSHNKAEAVNQ